MQILKVLSYFDKTCAWVKHKKHKNLTSYGHIKRFRQYAAMHTFKSEKELLHHRRYKKMKMPPQCFNLQNKKAGQRLSVNRKTFEFCYKSSISQVVDNSL